MPPLPSLPSTVSRSTPRVRLLTLAAGLCIVLVAVTARPLLSGAASPLAAALGFALVLVAALGRAWVSLFIAGRKDASLVRWGPYGVCRHPLYALSLVGAVGLGLGTRSLTLAVALFATAWWLHRRAIADEDALLVAMHGESARAFQAEVPALWPDFSRYELPETLNIRPRLAWKAFLDAAALFGAFALVDLAHVLQTTGVTPTLLRLW
jgi:protein-S-isoprenylcysteine O-methyltransferase Ste14